MDKEYWKLKKREQRRKKSLLEKEPVVDNATSETRDAGDPTDTDLKFDESKPGYYIFDVEPKKRTCWTCGKEFHTRLALNKFCSPECKTSYLSVAFRKG